MIRWMHKTGSTAIVEGVAKTIQNDTSDNKIIIKPLLDNKLFVIGVKSVNCTHVYAVSQYETDVLPTEVFAKFKMEFPDVQLVRPEPKKKDRNFE